MPNSSPDQNAMMQLGSLAREMATAPVSPDLHNEGRRRFIAAALAERKSPRLLSVQIKVLVAAAACIIVMLGVLLTRSRPLTYEVRNASRYDSGYLSAANDNPASIHFSDGSSIEASPATRVRVDTTTPNGARILLESGTAEANIHHTKSSNWCFVAGPFEVRVLGTSFDLGWDPAKGEVDLVLRRGRTEVTGPLGQGSFTVTGGQHFHASLQTRSVRFDETVSANVVPPSDTATATPNLEAAAPLNRVVVANEPVTSDKPPPAPLSFSNQTRSESAHHVAWTELARRGEFRSVVDQARDRGVDTCFTSCSIADLHALADSARYVGQPNLAEQSLKAMRERLAGGEQRAWAAFMLGRIAQSRGQSGPASTWYDTYLTEAPRGQFAADALAGKMQTTAQLYGPSVAKPLAMQYLERYPNGVHASTARKLTGTTP